MFFFVIGIAASLISGQFASGVAAVEVYATITDARGEPIQGLTAADFALVEDGIPQTISVFSGAKIPLALALGIDRSFSMAGPRLTGALSAARGLVEELGHADEIMVLGIGSEVETLAPLATDHGKALRALDRLDAWGTTPLFDATLEAIDAIQAARGRRALILLSDGTDRFSRATAADVIDRVRRSDVLIYAIALGKQRPPVFAELASVTGGRSLHVTEMKSLPSALSAIARELHLQYLLGYTPTRPPGPGAEWRAITVSVARPGARVRARDGYISR